MTRITRLEVIDENGRSYVNWEDDNNVSWQFQDDGRTLKVFVNKVEPKTPAEEAYKRWMGEYPPTTPSVSNYEDERWSAFQNGYTSAKEENVVEEPTKPMDEVVDRLVKKYQAQKLWNRVRDELGYSIDCCDEIVDLVEKWLPEYQSAAGSQNVDTELLVDGFNHCLNKINGKLR
jgi:hypothetical protein